MKSNTKLNVRTLVATRQGEFLPSRSLGELYDDAWTAESVLLHFIGPWRGDDSVHQGECVRWWDVVGTLQWLDVVAEDMEVHWVGKVLREFKGILPAFGLIRLQSHCFYWTADHLGCGTSEWARNLSGSQKNNISELFRSFRKIIGVPPSHALGQRLPSSTNGLETCTHDRKSAKYLPCCVGSGASYTVYLIIYGAKVMGYWWWWRARENRKSMSAGGWRFPLRWVLEGLQGREKSTRRKLPF